MEIFGFALTILAGVLTYLAWSNGKWMKATIEEMKKMIGKQSEILEKQSQTLEGIKEMIGKQSEILDKHSQILEGIKEMIEKQNETLKVMEKNAEERHREVIEIIKSLK